MSARKQRLEYYRQKYNQLINDSELHLLPHERAEIIDIIRKEWNPGYTVMEWCGHCVAEMVKYAFNLLDNDSTASNEQPAEAGRQVEGTSKNILYEHRDKGKIEQRKVYKGRRF